MRKDPLLAPRQPRAAAKTTRCHNYANYDIAMSNRRCSRLCIIRGWQLSVGTSVIHDRASLVTSSNWSSA
eukprot:scaffold34335_cov33-Attheya_sp.AAC.1